jgi:hypothetical protein
VIFRVGQPYSWGSVERLARKGAVIGIYMLDTISLDCTQLTSPKLYDLWQFALVHSDLIVTPSKQSMNQLMTRFQLPERVTRLEALHSLDLSDYALAGAGGTTPENAQSTLLVIGNHFPHKYLVPTANALAEAFPDRTIVALGQTKAAFQEPFNPYGLPDLSSATNLVGTVVGHYTDAEFSAFYATASVIVFPSHYEGFGYPVMNALAARRPIFVRRLPVFDELWEGQGRNPNIHFYETTAELIAQLQAIPVWTEPTESLCGDNGIARCAREIRAGIDTALANAYYRAIVERVRAVNFANGLSGDLAALPPAPKREPEPELEPEPEPAGPIAEPPPSPASEADKAASFLAARIEWLARGLFRDPFFLQVSRAIFRLGVRPAFRVLRGLRRLARGAAQRNAG